MPVPHDPFVDHCAELLGTVGSMRARCLFCGHGFHVDDLLVAILASDRLWLKVDATTLPAFEAAGSVAFVYQGAGKTVQLPYFSAPDEALDSPGSMEPWARQALAAAVRANAPKPAARARAVKATPSSAAAKTWPPTT